jgi:hypothetical protein
MTPARNQVVISSGSTVNDRLPSRISEAASMYTSVSAVRSSQSIMKAMVRAPGPAITMRASTPVALGTASMGGAVSADRAPVVTPGPSSRRAPLFFLGELFSLVFVLQ